MFGRLAALLLDNRLASLVILASVVLSISAGVAFLRAEFSASAFFASGDPESAFLAEYIEQWGDDDLLVLIIDAGGESLLTKPHLQAVDHLVATLRENPDITGVRAATTVPRVGPALAGRWIPVPLISTVPSNPEALASWRSEILSDPKYVPAMFSENGQYTAIFVQLNTDTDDLAALRPVVRRISTDATDALAGTQLSAHAAGVPALRSEILESILGDQAIIIPVASLLILVLLAHMFRSIHGVLIPAIAAGVPATMLIGTMGWLGEPIGLFNQSFFVLIPVIAVADGIHLLNRYHEETWKGDQPLNRTGRRAAIVRALAFMGMACFLTSFTTAVGFLSHTATKMPVLKMFGIYAGIGIGLAYLTVLAIIPLALSTTRIAARRPRHTGDYTERTLRGFGRFAVRRPGTSLFITAVLVVLSLAAGWQVTIDMRLTGTFEPDHPISIGNTIVDEHLGGLLTVEFALDGAPGDFEQAEVIQSIHRLERSAAGRDAIRASWGLGTLLASASSMVGGPYAVPSSQGLTNRLYALNANTGELASLVDEDASRSRMILRTRDIGAVALISLGEELQEEFSRELAEHQIEAHLTGTSYVAYRGLSRVSTDLRDSLILAFGVIGLVIAVLFRSPVLGLISLIPNMVPLMIGYGLMGVTGWLLEPAAAIVFTVALGIAVDCTIHLLARFTEELGKGRSVARANYEAVVHSGRAIAVTTVILAVGFIANGFSSFPANAVFGILGAVMVCASLFCNLLVLPAILFAVYGRDTVSKPPTTSQAFQ